MDKSSCLMWGVFRLGVGSSLSLEHGEGHQSSLESAGYTPFNEQLHFLCPLLFSI